MDWTLLRAVIADPAAVLLFAALVGAALGRPS